MKYDINSTLYTGSACLYVHTLSISDYIFIGAEMFQTKIVERTEMDISCSTHLAHK
jgi:hypothetical protein